MESIIIFALFVAVSSIFQIVKESAKKQTAQPAVKPSKPVAAPHRSPVNQNAGHISSEPKPQPVYTTSVHSEYNQGPMEGIQTEAVEYSAPIAQKQVTPDAAPANTFQDIQYDDLQRSIVMAEILGKPKALKRNTK